MSTSVKSYSDNQLLKRMRRMTSFRYMPSGYHIIAIRSSEDVSDKYDDKLYLFKGEKFVMVMSCTTNSGVYGLRNFHKWNKKGTAVTKSNEIYYNAFQKSDGRRVRHHNGKMQCLRQVAPMKYFRDNNRDNKIDEVGRIYEGNYSTNIHTNSYKHRTGLWSWVIRRWSTGCLVVNDLTKYYRMLKAIPFGQKVTYTLLKEF